MLCSLAFSELASVPRASPAPGLFKVGVLGFFGVFFFPSFKSRIVGLSLITMDTRQIESRICARDLVFKCLRKSGRIGCRESGKERAAPQGGFFVGKKFVGIGRAACLPVEIWPLIPINFQHDLILIFCFIGIFVWTIKGKLG